MKKLLGCFGVVFVVGFASYSYATFGEGVPIKYLSSCEIDLNGDNQPDIVFLVETSKERELIVLLTDKVGYKAFVVSRGKPDMYLTCHFGKTVREVSPDKRGGAGKDYTTPGAYIQLTLPEGSAMVYFWDGNGFKNVWISD